MKRIAEVLDFSLTCFAEPVAKLGLRDSTNTGFDGNNFYCGTEKLNKICTSDFLTNFEQKHANMTDSCKGELSQARTVVCDTWKSGNASQSCAAFMGAWKKVEKDHCLPEHQQKG